MKPEQQPDAWRFRYPGGKWTVQKNRPAWYRDHMSDVELEPLFSQAALLEAEQRGRRMGMEEAAKIADGYADDSMSAHLTKQTKFAADTAARSIASEIRAKLDEVQK